MNPIVKTSLRMALFGSLLLGSTTPIALAQKTTADAKSPAQPTNAGNVSQAQIDEIVRKFAAKETQFRRALNDYAFKRDALVQEIGMGGQVIGEYHRVSSFTFDDQGNRFEKINFFPMATFPGVTAEDIEDLGGVNPFALEAAKIPQYNFKYVGKERIDELDLYVFDVAPKTTPDPKKTKERFFIGRIWVDDRDLQIVKSKGKGIPETKINKFPVVETYREQIDGKYWFPTYSYADDDLIFDNGNDLHIRMRVKYSDFVVGRGKVTITEIGETLPPNSAKPQTQPTPSATASQPENAAQPRNAAGVESGQTIEGGIINDKAIELPAPKYPEAAKRFHAAGQVQVRVLVDELGKVVTAEALFGPNSLMGAAVEAARQARFTPAKINGVPVKVSGIITYEFTAQ